jgi:hypothetical protein
MAKKIIAVVFGFALAPAFIAAENSIGTSLVGTTCLVRVYHTNFAFPPQGGRIVQIGDEMFFWRTYLPECQGVLPASQPVVVTTHTGTVPTSINPGMPSSIVGDSCAVRVYHTNFRFPPQGGKIVLIGNEMFFIRDYRPGCELAGLNGTVLVSGSSAGVQPSYNSFGQPVPTTPVVTTPVVTTPNTRTCF